MGLLFCLTAGSAVAVGPGSPVVYDPVSKDIYGVVPVTSSYPLNVTVPASVTQFPLTVTLRKTATYIPVGDEATALTYVQFSADTLTFNAPGETQTVTISLNFPASALLPGMLEGLYAYRIYTDGWPSGVKDSGASISSSISLPTSPVGSPPTITIDTPTDGIALSYTAGSVPSQGTFQFHAATDLLSPTITSVDAALVQPNPVNLTVTTSGLGTAAVTGTGSFPISGPGTYILQARATNALGSTIDTNTFTIKVTAPAPTVAIASPVSGTTYTYWVGDPAQVVPVSFTALSNYGGIRTLTAKLDGANLPFTLSGIDTLTATGSTSLSFTTAGSHTIVVTTTDDNGTATAQTTFTINVVAPTPVVSISAPTPSQLFTLPVGATTMNIPYAFTTTSNNGFKVDSVSAVLGTTPVTPTTTGLGTATATSTGTLTNLGVGTYTLTATGVSAGITDQDSVTFTIKGAQVAPSVVINAPPAGSVYTRVNGGPAVSIPLSFTGTSNTPGGVITKLTASVDGTPVTVTATNLGQKTATGTATLSVTTAGTHTISVAAVDAYGTANATRTFVVTLVQGRTICGETFFDVDFDGRQDCGEFGLSGITVKLLNSSNQVIATDVTDCGGDYAFCNIGPGTYTVVATPSAGLSATNSNERSVTVSSCSVHVPDMGFGLDFKALRAMKADGYTIGYWKNNLDKALSGKTNGTQVSKGTLLCYTEKIGDLALSPFDDITMKKAVSTMSSNSSKPTDLLAKQLLASEYNYANSAYLNGNKTLTFLFVWWGEYVLSHPSNYSNSYLLWAKDWFDAYNNSHGGVVAGPAP